MTDNTITVNGETYTYSRTLSVMITAYTHTGRKTSTASGRRWAPSPSTRTSSPTARGSTSPATALAWRRTRACPATHIDVFFDTEAECISYGRKRDRTIYILE